LISSELMIQLERGLVLLHHLTNRNLESLYHLQCPYYDKISVFLQVEARMPYTAQLNDLTSTRTLCPKYGRFILVFSKKN